MSLLANSNAIEDVGYKLQRSLRFRSSASAYLSRTFGTPTNNTIWSMSLWLKRGALSATQDILSANISSIWFGTDDKLNFYKNSVGNVATSSAVFRDPSAWYHFVFVSNGTTVIGYCNNLQVISYTGTIPQFNSATAHNLCRNVSNGVEYFDGYLAEVNFIDGQALTPSSFGQTDAVTGVWTPKKYTGTYGTNGFYLPFTDNSSPTTLGYDKSGNGNNWTANNISTTSGASYDSMTDVPTLTSATAANYCVLNPLDNYSAYIALQSGNLTCNQTGNDSMVRATFGMTSGKWYWEATLGNTKANVGIATQAANLANYLGSDAYGWGYYSAGQKVNSGSTPSYGSSFTTNDVIGVAFDADSGSLEFYKNGVSQGTAFTGLTSGPYFPAQGTSASLQYFNFGQRPFSYTPPTGFKALNTFNLPDPTIKKPNQYMDATLWAGNSSTQNITNSGSMQPDLVWIKDRSVARSNRLIDSSRGTTHALVSDTTDAEDTDTTKLTSFNSNGFSLSISPAVNGTGETYVGWQWKKGATPGFDIVTYTGNATARNISHSLGVAPKFIIVKDRSNTNPWPVYHASLGVQYYTLLNATDASYNNLANYWGSSAPTSTYFSVNTYGGNNANGDNFVAYLFAEIAGFSKFGSYNGNGSADGVFCYLGFRPKYVLIKPSSVGYGWNTYDSVRSPTNTTDLTLQPNLSGAESNSTLYLDMTSNGFKIRTALGELNQNGQTYIYAAFAENPFKYSLAR